MVNTEGYTFTKKVSAWLNVTKYLKILWLVSGLLQVTTTFSIFATDRINFIYFDLCVYLNSFLCIDENWRVKSVVGIEIYFSQFKGAHQLWEKIVFILVNKLEYISTIVVTVYSKIMIYSITYIPVCRSGIFIFFFLLFSKLYWPGCGAWVWQRDRRLCCIWD